jgi:hypothetical protein
LKTAACFRTAALAQGTLPVLKQFN